MEQNKIFSAHNEPVTLSTSFQVSIPTVSAATEDADLVMEHLNDPNYDLNKTISSSSDAELAGQKGDYCDFELDHLQSDSATYSTSNAQSTVPSAVDFDEWVACVSRNAH